MREVVAWAAALQAESAAELLDTLYADGALDRPDNARPIEPATFADLPPWLRLEPDHR